MGKRTIKLRGTDKFRRVNVRPKGPTYTWNGQAWVLGEQSQAMSVNAGEGVIWSSCATTNGGAGKGGGGTKMQTAFGKPQMRRDLERIGTGIGLMGLGLSATGFLAPMGLPIFATGVMFNIAAGSIRKVTFSRPCIDPALQEGMKVSFEEPDFNTFQQQYAAYLAGRSSDRQNVRPLEME